MKTILHTEASMGLGGQELRTLAEMRGFQNKSYKVILACQPGSLILDRARSQGFPIHSIKMRNSLDPLAIASFCKLLRKENVSILNTHSSLDSWTAGIAGRLVGVPTIIRTRHVSISIKNKLVYTWMADKVITTSNSIKEYVEKRCGFNGNKVFSIPTGVDLTRFKLDNHSTDSLRKELELNSEHILIAIIGMIRWCKGLDIFLASAKILSERYPNARFLVVGFDPDGKIDFSGEIKKQNLENVVHYLGFREDIPEILASIDILVSASTAAEGVSQAILQGLAMNRPVVATKIGGSPEVVIHQHTGLLVPPNDGKSLAQAVGELIDSPEKRKLFGENGGRLVLERYTSEQMIERIEEVYA